MGAIPAVLPLLLRSSASVLAYMFFHSSVRTNFDSDDDVITTLLVACAFVLSFVLSLLLKFGQKPTKIRPYKLRLANCGCRHFDKFRLNNTVQS